MKVKIAKIQRFFIKVFRSYGEHECGSYSASLAYFGLFSIFPLLLFLVSLGSFLLPSISSKEAIDNYLIKVIPMGAENIIRIIDQTLAARGSIGIIGTIGLLWSGSSVFIWLEISLSKIWNTKPRSYWRRRVLAIISVFVLGITFLTTFFLGPIARWLLGGMFKPYAQLAGNAFEIIIFTIAILLLYRVFPNKQVTWGPAFLGSFLSGIMIVFIKFLFGIYINVVITNYGLIYGSLAWLLALAIWVYLLAVLILLGAEIAAEIQSRLE